MRDASPVHIGGVPRGDFFERLRSEFTDKGVTLDDFPAYSEYLGYLEKFSSINVESILTEIEAAEGLVYGVLAQTEDAERLLGITRYLDILKNYFSLKLKPYEFDIYRKNIEEFKTAAWLGFINRKLIEAGRHKEVIPYDPVLDDEQGRIGNFYSTVQERDHAHQMTHQAPRK